MIDYKINIHTHGNGGGSTGLLVYYHYQGLGSKLITDRIYDSFLIQALNDDSSFITTSGECCMLNSPMRLAI